MRLVAGSGSEKTGACWMSAVHYYVRNGNTWTDHPECVSPLIRRLCIGLNDWLKSDKDREKYIGPHIFAPVGTNTGTADEIKRGFLCADRAVRVFAPFWLRHTKRANLIANAEKLEAVAPIVDQATAQAAKHAAQVARYAAYAAYAASAAYAADAAHAADAVYAADAEHAYQWVAEQRVKLILDCCAIGQKAEVCPTKTKEQVTEFLCSFDKR